MSAASLKADLVLEGGGVKGIGLAGALEVLEAAGYTWMNLAGTSAGAIVASLVAAGYKATQLKRVMEELDYNRLKDKSTLDRVPFGGPLLSLVFEKGIYEGDYLVEWLSGLLEERGVRTFADLVMEEFREDERYRFRLQVVASDISLGKLLVLPRDIQDYGVRSQCLNVALAVRMSMSIPFFYEPVRLRHRRTNRESYIVDGGVLSNFPVWLFDTQGEIPPWPTFGLKLVEPQEEKVEQRVKGPISLLSALFSTMMEAHDARYIQEQHFVRTIPIPTLGVRTTEFDLPPQKRDALYRSGQEAARKFLAGWDFAAYIDKYRRPGSPHHRRS